MTDTIEESAVDVLAETIGPLALRGDPWAQAAMARVTAAADQEAEARRICDEVYALIQTTVRMFQPWVKAAMADRRVRAVEVLTQEGLDADEIAGETEHLEDGWKPDRYMLVEKNRRSTPPYYLTTHRTPEAAGAYHWGQEYCADYDIEVLVDLQTGDRYEVEQRFIARKVAGDG
jgi:hypothetical protein